MKGEVGGVIGGSGGWECRHCGATRIEGRAGGRAKNEVQPRDGEVL